MKYILLVFLIFSCNVGQKDSLNIKRTIIIGSDTLYINNGSSDYTKIHGHYRGHGVNDTLNKIFYDTLWLQEAITLQQVFDKENSIFKLDTIHGDSSDSVLVINPKTRVVRYRHIKLKHK